MQRSVSLSQMKPAKVKRAAAAEAKVTVRTGVQILLACCHAAESARVRRTFMGFECLASRERPVRITSGRVEGLPGTLNRMDVCITLGIMWLLHEATKNGYLSVAVTT